MLVTISESFQHSSYERVKPKSQDAEHLADWTLPFTRKENLLFLYSMNKKDFFHYLTFQKYFHYHALEKDYSEALFQEIYHKLNEWLISEAEPNSNFIQHSLPFPDDIKKFVKEYNSPSHTLQLING